MATAELAAAVAAADLDERTRAAIAAAVAGNPWPAYVRALTRTMGVSQRALASILGRHPITVCHWCTGENVPDPESQRRIAELERALRRHGSALCPPRPQ